MIDSDQWLNLHKSQLETTVIVKHCHPSVFPTLSLAQWHWLIFPGTAESENSGFLLINRRGKLASTWSGDYGFWSFACYVELHQYAHTAYQGVGYKNVSLVEWSWHVQLQLLLFREDGILETGYKYLILSQHNGLSKGLVYVKANSSYAALSLQSHKSFGGVILE